MNSYKDDEISQNAVQFWNASQTLAEAGRKFEGFLYQMKSLHEECVRQKVELEHIQSASKKQLEEEQQKSKNLSEKLKQALSQIMKLQSECKVLSEVGNRNRILSASLDEAQKSEAELKLALDMEKRKNSDLLSEHEKFQAEFKNQRQQLIAAQEAAEQMRHQMELAQVQTRKMMEEWELQKSEFEKTKQRNIELTHQLLREQQNVTGLRSLVERIRNELTQEQKRTQNVAEETRKRMETLFRNEAQKILQVHQKLSEELQQKTCELQKRPVMEAQDKEVIKKLNDALLQKKQEFVNLQKQRQKDVDQLLGQQRMLLGDISFLKQELKEYLSSKEKRETVHTPPPPPKVFQKAKQHEELHASVTTVALKTIESHEALPQMELTKIIQ